MLNELLNWRQKNSDINIEEIILLQTCQISISTKQIYIVVQRDTP